MSRFLLFALVITAGCPGLGQVAFDVQSQGQSTIPGSPTSSVLPSALGFDGLGPTQFSQSQDFSNHNTNKGHITSCRVSRLTLKVTSPSGGTLSFLSKIEFFIQTSTLGPVRIAEALSIPPGAMTIDDQEIAPYAKSDNFSITTKASGTSPQQNTVIEADLTLHIEANVL